MYKQEYEEKNALLLTEDLIVLRWILGESEER